MLNLASKLFMKYLPSPPIGATPPWWGITKRRTVPENGTENGTENGMETLTVFWEGTLTAFNYLYY